MTNLGVEDVLSSIRRLVSEKVESGAPDAKPAMPGRLVLTPAQRVPDEIDEIADQHPARETATLARESEQVLPEPMVLRKTDRAPEPALDMFVHRAARDKAEQPEQGEDRTVRAQASDALSVLVEQEVMQALSNLDAESGPEGAAIAEPVGDADPTMPENTEYVEAVEIDAISNMLDTELDKGALSTKVKTSTRAEVPRVGLTLEQKILELETMISETSGGWDDEADAEQIGTAAFVQGVSDSLPWRDFHDDDQEDASSRAHPAIDAFSNVVTSRLWPDAAPETDAEQTLEAAIAVDDMVEDEAEDSSMIPTDERPSDQKRGSVPLSDADALIDEDMLRDMVAEIVRRELQGALGERITRNVRKLVRREIQRALLVQDFE
ncbi:hypothetical protein [Puniceibacterium sp. IMCC21224]|uniref:hypothetical protein n=1 Tax=Puniceibacterium sp. IMCC21224 TaxID=1618204 RepID=UPI00069F6CCA|nr:hypothetical protein [Puniceibacterium sp. IMCC21224]